MSTCPCCHMPRRTMEDSETLLDIFERVRPTIGETFGAHGMTVEGRILADDFQTLMRFLGFEPVGETQ